MEEVNLVAPANTDALTNSHHSPSRGLLSAGDPLPESNLGNHLQDPIATARAAIAHIGAGEGGFAKDMATQDTMAKGKIVDAGSGDVTAQSPTNFVGDDKITSTSKGLADLDLAAHTIPQFDGAPDQALEAFPLLQPQSPDFSTYFDPPPDMGPPKIKAFAKIEFEDGQYYLNTHAVELGRDVRAAKRAQQRRFQREVTRRDRRRRGSDSSDDPIRQRPFRYPTSSAVSESGGIVNFESLERRPRRKSKHTKRSTSPSSSSFGRSRNNSIGGFDYQTLAYKHLIRPGSGRAEDPASYVPSLDDVPLIPVHPPNDEDQPGAGYTGISRRHARIAYNFDAGCFELEILGRNGGFVDEIWLECSEIASLSHGSKIQIGGVVMIFLLPNRGHTHTENTDASEAVSAMSFEFEDGRGDSIPMIDTSGSASSEELPRNEDDSEDSTSGIEEAGHTASDEDSDDSQNIHQSIEEDDLPRGANVKGRSGAPKSKKQHNKPGKAPKLKLKLKNKSQVKDETNETSSKPKPKSDAAQQREEANKPELNTLKDIANRLGMTVDELPTRKKGPGRPPKDGVMSKREYAQLVRQQKERQRAEGLQNGTVKPAKAAIGPDGAPVEKRKYTKRKKLEESDDPNGVREVADGLDDGEDGSPQATKIPKEKRPPKPPRSPSPEIDASTLTEEQLAKPTQSYVVLIHEALSNSSLGRMSLPQIYKAIERRYPYYKFKVTTQGWQSSVRHNLSQHAAFRKIEKDGKGWMWGLVPEVSIEKEKKRRPTPPATTQQTFYPTALHQQYRPTQFGFSPGVPQAGTMQPPAQLPPSFPMPAQGYSTTIPDVARTFGNALLTGQTTGPSTYLSPYTPAPSAPTPAPPGAAYPGIAHGSQPATTGAYYMAPTTGVPVSVAPTTTSVTAAPHDASVTPAPAFIPIHKNVPQSMLDACVNFKSKLVEHVGSSAEMMQTIDRALNRALASVMNGDEAPPNTDDKSENIFLTEAHKALRGIWIWETQSKPTTEDVPSNNEATAGPDNDNTMSAKESTPVPETDTKVEPKTDGTEVLAQTGTAKSPVTPLEQHQQAPILHLLQQLDSSAEAMAETSGAQGVDDVRNVPAESAVPVPTQHSEIMSASRDAAKKAITALNVSTKRGHDEDQDKESNGNLSSEAGHNLRRPSKRVAV